MEKIIFSSCFCYEGFLFFYDEMKGNSGKIRLADNIIFYAPELNVSNGFLDYFIEKYIVSEYGIFGVTVSGRYIIRYDMKNNNTVIAIEAADKSWGNFAYICSCGKKLLLFTKMTQKLISVDMNSLKVSYTKLKIHPDNGCSIGKQIIIFDKKEKKFWAFDPDTEEAIVLKQDFEIDDVKYLDTDGSKLYVMSSNGNVYIFNVCGNDLTLFKKIEYENKDIMLGLCIMGDEIVVLPAEGKDIMIVDSKEKISSFEGYPEDFEYTHEGWSKYFGFVDVGDDRYYAMRSTNYILHIDRKNKKISFEKPVLKEGHDSIEYLMNTKGYFSEKQMALKEYIKSV